MAEVILAIVGLALALKPFSYPTGFISIYGPTGIIVSIFGSSVTWRVQLEILTTARDDDALAFKKWTVDECNMTAITGAIIAQLVISSLSLDLLSQTHWSARACLMFSLVASLMAVYFAAMQSRKIGRLFKGEEIRTWIRKGRVDKTRELISRLQTLGTGENFIRECDYVSEQVRGMKGHRTNMDITPAPSSLLSLSAPSMLLSASVFTFLAGIGVYLGFLYGKRFNTGHGIDDDRNIFIVYIIALGLCSLVYYFASWIMPSIGEMYNMGREKHFGDVFAGSLLFEFRSALQYRERMIKYELEEATKRAESKTTRDKRKV
ncbi:hypothetical protein TWF730_001890 [Orbilia blumenaviensis]|uniref:Uncharacterized protein n=1 Tax=Orbilia blumenaviensis TaxID=1796055 RepID=A0AAV9UCC7_9PEZI